MQQSSPVPALQQLRAVHPGALQHLQQGPNEALFPHHQALSQTHPNDVVYHQQQQQQYTLGAPPQPPAQAIQYQHQHQHQHHGLPPSPAQFTSFPAAYTAPQPIPVQHFHGSQLAARPTPTQQAEEESRPQQQGTEDPSSNHGQFHELKLVADPPHLEAWRQKLFDVDETITLNEDEFKTYFPHIDNVYSHRSTQRHKRKRFVSHYWDCRLKGRPPGTKKSTDPDKKKRKRVARERDLCDVKVKITEYFDRHEYEEQLGVRPPGANEEESTNPLATNGQATSGPPLTQNQHFFGQPQMLPQRPVNGWQVPQNMAETAMAMSQFTTGPGPGPGPAPLPRPAPKKYYTFQRVNGNGGNGKGDGVAGPHKHTLEESDRVKKNSVVRWLAKCEKDDRKKMQGGDPSKKTYHKKATGNALTTVKNHSKEDDLKLYGSAFCPFVQRVWISLEHKQIPYQYIEVDPYRKPQTLLDVNPRGLVPAIRHGPTWSTHESTIILEYLEDLNTGPSLLPQDPQSRATSRLWTDHVNRHIIPAFYTLLQAQDPQDQTIHATSLRTHIATLVAAAHPIGPFFLGPHMSFVDVHMAPWVLRLRRVLGPYRGWPAAEEGSRWAAWVDAIEGQRSVVATTSGDELYFESYERYAENRPGTSEVADAVNAGRGLP
ncbi:hypothetical protein GQ44DRAFT_605013 [Phaeosphaeriaceae sp. PMI808]|nr:hypothetical protein GQ44DRAFT_605013 [Phaeosphaeriaceae sp. PMI808]